MEYINYMKSRASLMTIVPSAGLIPIRANGQAKSLLVDGASNKGPIVGANGDRPGANWLVAEDEYFPFDADNFEER